MKKTVLAAILVATALVPPVLAQDRGERRGDRSEASAPARQQSERSDRGPGRQSAPQAQPQRQWQGDRSARPQGQAAPQQRQWNGGDRSQWRQPRDQSPQQAAAQPGTSPQRQWNGGDRDGRRDRGQWNGNNRDGRDDRNQWNGNRDRRDDRAGWDNGNRGRYDRGNPGWNGGRGNAGQFDRNNRSWNDRNGGRWNNSWRNDRRYDWRGYRTSNRSLYRLPRYYAPSGWGYGYRRFSVGFTLSAVLFSQQYWINDPFYYRLPEVDGPYRWVRYYNDALLVDIYTGQVVDTIYDIFW